MNLVVLGLSISSSWGNGHATTFRGLLREFKKRGHDIHFLERDVPWYATNRDLPNPDYCKLSLYESLEELKDTYEDTVRNADAVIVGSYVPEGVEVGHWACSTAKGPVAFYDIDTPVTLAKLERRDYEYLTPGCIQRYDMYLSFTGGPTLQRLEQEFGSPKALPLYCSFDPALYFPEEAEMRWSLGYMGTYSDDRQPPLETMLIEPARRMSETHFVVAGPMYPPHIEWPANVERIEHLPPKCHRSFYNSQLFTLNVTRADMVKAGWSPSVRLFEAAACGTPIISDYWDGLGDFFELDTEILISRSAEDTMQILRTTDADERQSIAERARARVMEQHTAAKRAEELESYLLEAHKGAFT